MVPLSHTAWSAGFVGFSLLVDFSFGSLYLIWGSEPTAIIQGSYIVHSSSCAAVYVWKIAVAVARPSVTCYLGRIPEQDGIFYLALYTALILSGVIYNAIPQIRSCSVKNEATIVSSRRKQCCS
ncbi:hypothetical protein ACFX2G_021756 [Malus domestica]